MEFYAYNRIQNGKYPTLVLFKPIGTGAETPET